MGRLYAAASKETMSAPGLAKRKTPTCTSSTLALRTAASTRLDRVINTVTSATPDNMPARRNQAICATMKEAILFSSEERIHDVMSISRAPFPPIIEMNTILYRYQRLSGRVHDGAHEL